MKLEKQSALTGRLNTMELDVTDEQWRAFQEGAHPREAFPHLDRGEIEFIISGITPAEWNSYFGDN